MWMLHTFFNLLSSTVWNFSWTIFLTILGHCHKYFIAIYRLFKYQSERWNVGKCIYCEFSYYFLSLQSERGKTFNIPIVNCRPSVVYTMIPWVVASYVPRKHYVSVPEYLVILWTIIFPCCLQVWISFCKLAIIWHYYLLHKAISTHNSQLILLFV